MPRTAIVIGAGIAGIATSIRLAAKGYRVTVYEKNAYPGGKLTAFEQGGFRFDAGPSLFTMPHLVTDLFEACGENASDHFEYRRMDEACRYFWDDGTTLIAHADTQEFAKEVHRVLEVEPQTIITALEHSRKLYDLTGEIFTQRSLHKAGTWFSADVAKAVVRIFSLDILTTMHTANEKRLKHPKLVQLFDRFATYNGSSPYKAPGILNMIPHLEHNMGTYFPVKGMHSITQSLVELAKRQDVVFEFDQKVAKIFIENKQLRGIQVDGKTHLADVVVCNSDIVPSYLELMPEQKAPQKVIEQERSGSAVIFYWGIDKTFDELGFHNIFFSNDYKAEFDHIFEQKTVSDDPTVYVHISSKEAPGDAPAGQENWFVMVNVPADEGQDWDALIPQIKKQVLHKLQVNLGADIASHIVCESILEPRTIASKTSSWKGALYGAASNDRYAAFLRHANFSKKIKGLYFCGGSVHPGGGIPLCLLSAKIATDLIPKA